MKFLLAFLILSISVHGQRFIARPVIHEKCDTIVYHANHETFIICRFNDGSAWVQDRTGVAYYSKKYYRRWRRKNVKM